ncbi:MAG: ATP-binding protein, partial [Leptospiraceae bacterium]|nr:ATP-binding protein [Leptospiraceae bacterium]
INLVDLIIRNLVNNAIKFTPENGSIQISAEKSSELIEISVKDSGMGIPPEILNNLFKIGSKVTRKGSNKEDGTGLGLILVHEFVKNSGGDIRIESEVDKGSNFIFTLPEGK